MAGTVKGICIEFRGDTTKLSKALTDVRKETRDLDKELGYIDNSLKFNPGNLDLIKQKMTVLEQAADKAGDNADDLKKALDQMKADGVDETSTEYRELEREIIRAESKQKDYNKQLDELKRKSSTLGQVATKIGEFGSKAEAAGKALAPISAAAGAVDLALAGLAYKSGKAADDLNTLSTQTGISTEDLQKYAAAADLVDVPLETMTKSQVKLTKSMSAAKDGSKKQAEAFEKLGVAVTDSNGELRDAGDVFDDTIKALGKMENPTERNALAQKIFGKNAGELNSLIADGGKTYEQVAKVYEDNDLSIVDQETLDKANQFNDSIDTIKLTAQAALSKVGTQLAGYLAPAMDKISKALSKIMGFISNLDPQILTVIGIIAGVVAALAPLLIVIGKVATGISAIMTLGTKIGPMLTGLAGPVGIAIAIFAALVAAGVLIYKNWDKIKETATKVKTWVVQKWTELKNSITTLFNTIKTTVSNVWNSIKTKVVTTVTTIKTTALILWTALKTGIAIIIDTIKTKVATVWDAIKTKVSTVVNGIKDAVSTAWDTIKTTVATVVDGIKTKVSTVWDAIKTKIKTVVDGIKSAVAEKFDAIKTKISTVVDSIKTSVKEKFDAIKEKIISPIETAKEKVKEIIDKIKSIIGGVKLQLPKFKLPHLSVSAGEAPWGIGGKGKLPSFSVDWYKKGGIFDSPTIIGVGEAGAEAVLPIEKLKDWMQPSGVVINVYAPEGMDVQALASEVERKLVNSVKRKQYAWG